MHLSRRNLLKAGLSLTALTVASPAFAMFQLSPYTYGGRDGGKKTLKFFNTHTLESTEAMFFDGTFDQQGLEKIYHILRDHRSGEVAPIDKDLLVMLHDLKVTLDTNEPFHIISGFRSEKTNAMLRQNSEGVAKKSFHMKGMAIDIRVPGINTQGLCDLAKDSERGGVGYYAPSDFVHLDTGPVRSW
jgi:uncharacterized protein YcbK (DUF882 family)